MRPARCPRPTFCELSGSGVFSSDGEMMLHEALKRSIQCDSWAQCSKVLEQIVCSTAPSSGHNCGSGGKIYMNKQMIKYVNVCDINLNYVRFHDTMV